MERLTKRTMQILIAPEGSPIFSDNAFLVTIKDDGGGEYLAIKQQDDDPESGTINVERNEWDALKHYVDGMFAGIETHKPTS